MNLLLDTHTLLWFDTEPTLIPAQPLSLIRDKNNQVYASAISAWELTIKLRLGKLAKAEPLLNSYPANLIRYGVIDLPFSSAHAIAEKSLGQAHEDPFDRALIAQALSENLTLVSSDLERLCTKTTTHTHIFTLL